jgi:hypothetical protein
MWLPRVLVIAFVMISVSVSFGQIVIHDTDFSGIGASYTWARADSVSFDIGQGGSDQTWTFGNFTWDWRAQTDIVDPATHDWSFFYPTATRASRTRDDSVRGRIDYYVEAINPDSVRELGMAWEDSPGWGISRWLGEIQTRALPLVFNSTWTELRWGYEVDSSGNNVMIVDSSLHAVDAWGTVQTPHSISACLRDRIHKYHKTSIDWSAETVTQSYEYVWYNQQGNEAVSVKSNLGVNDPNFTTGTLTMMGVPLSTDPATWPTVTSFFVGQNHPNPFNPTTTLPITLDRSSMVTLDVFDALGRLAFHSVAPMSIGTHGVPINANGWASGNYFARVSTGARCQTVGMQLIK